MNYLIINKHKKYEKIILYYAIGCHVTPVC